jgi:hypothetical protein
LSHTPNARDREMTLEGASFTDPNARDRESSRHEAGDAYPRYNALLRELASFESALDRRLRTARPG